MAVLTSDLLVCYLVTLNAAVKRPCLLFNAPKLRDLHGSVSPTCRTSALPSTTVIAIGCRVQTLPTTFFSSRPELWLSVPKLSRSCIPRGWAGLLTQSTWPSCGLSSGHSPPPCWLLQSCGNALASWPAAASRWARASRDFSGLLEGPRCVLLALICVYFKLVILFCFHSGHSPDPSYFGFISCYSLNILYLNILNYIRVWFFF